MGRRLGQHFLTRQSYLERISLAACPERTRLVLEIGPGKGALTDYLLERAERVVAVEIDPILVQYLRAKYRDQERIEIVEADILKTDLGQWSNFTVAGNLPYYITSPIVERVLGLHEKLTRAVFLVQKEVAIRMTTGPGSRDYGYLSVSTQFFGQADLLFTIPPGAFKPPPKVDSAVVQLTPRRELAIEDPRKFLQFASRCFRQKRKTLRNNLAAFYPKEQLDPLSEMGKRAEQLSIQELLTVHQKLAAVQPLPGV